MLPLFGSLFKTRLTSPTLVTSFTRSFASWHPSLLSKRLGCHLRLSDLRSSFLSKSFKRPYYSGGQRKYPWHELIPSEAYIYGIIGVNALVFIAWWYAQSLAKTKGDTSALAFMRRNFVLGVPQVFGLGHVWTLLTAAFSHYDLWHFGINMFVLHSFGPTVIDIVGKRQFLPFYLGTALVSSLASLGFQMASLDPSNRFAPQGSVGASGAIYGATTVFALTFPRAPIAIFGIIPAPAGLAIGGFMAWDLYRTYSKSGGSTDTVGHLGGAAAGALYWFLRLRFRM